jgi:hypothetical protein
MMSDQMQRGLRHAAGRAATAGARLGRYQVL